MNTEEVIVYRGMVIKCPLCGRNHGLTLKSSVLNAPYTENDEIWIKCPTCNLEFEGTAVARWNRTKAFEELGKAAQNFNNTMSKLSSATKTIYTVFLLDEVNHTVTRCFRTPMKVDGLCEVLKRLSKTCRSGESYIAIEEVE
jgi:phage terminase large subunit GpA-like protein